MAIRVRANCLTVLFGLRATAFIVYVKILIRVRQSFVIDS